LPELSFSKESKSFSFSKSNVLELFKNSKDLKKIKDAYHFTDNEKNVKLYFLNNRKIIVSEISTTDNSRLQAVSYFDDNSNNFNTIIVEFYSNESFSNISQQKVFNGGLNIKALDEKGTSNFLFENNKTHIKVQKSSPLVNALSKCVGDKLNDMGTWEFILCMATTPSCMLILNMECIAELA
jgi:hypothetical protein